MKLKREPDVIIGDGYLSRWWVIPRNKYFNIYLHKFVGNDDDRAQHDHPWWSISFLFVGELKERYFHRTRIVPWIWPVIRSARFTHRLELVQGPAWTLFITGPVSRHWGFHCNNRWVPWREFTDEAGTGVGAGCGESFDQPLKQFRVRCDVDPEYNEILTISELKNTNIHEDVIRVLDNEKIGVDVYNCAYKFTRLT